MDETKPATKPSTSLIDEVTDFYKFAVKQDAAYDGTCVFDVRPDGSSAYKVSVRLSPGTPVQVWKGLPPDGKYNAYIEMGESDFIKVYEGASWAEVAAMVVAGRIKVHWLRFDELRNFSLSYDFSVKTWLSFFHSRGEYEREAELWKQQWSAADKKGWLVGDDGELVDPRTLSDTQRDALIVARRQWVSDDVHKYDKDAVQLSTERSASESVQSTVIPISGPDCESAQESPTSPESCVDSVPHDVQLFQDNIEPETSPTSPSSSEVSVVVDEPTMSLDAIPCNEAVFEPTAETSEGSSLTVPIPGTSSIDISLNSSAPALSSGSETSLASASTDVEHEHCIAVSASNDGVNQSIVQESVSSRCPSPDPIEVELVASSPSHDEVAQMHQSITDHDSESTMSPADPAGDNVAMGDVLAMTSTRSSTGGADAELYTFLRGVLDQSPPSQSVLGSALVSVVDVHSTSLYNWLHNHCTSLNDAMHHDEQFIQAGAPVGSVLPDAPLGVLTSAGSAVAGALEYAQSASASLTASLWSTVFGHTEVAPSPSAPAIAEALCDDKPESVLKSTCRAYSAAMSAHRSIHSGCTASYVHAPWPRCSPWIKGQLFNRYSEPLLQTDEHLLESTCRGLFLSAADFKRPRLAAIAADSCVGIVSPPSAAEVLVNLVHAPSEKLVSWATSSDRDDWLHPVVEHWPRRSKGGVSSSGDKAQVNPGRALPPPPRRSRPVSALLGRDLADDAHSVDESDDEKDRGAQEQSEIDAYLRSLRHRIRSEEVRAAHDRALLLRAALGGHADVMIWGPSHPLLPPPILVPCAAPLPHPRSINWSSLAIGVPLLSEALSAFPLLSGALLHEPTAPRNRIVLPSVLHGVLAAIAGSPRGPGGRGLLLGPAESETFVQCIGAGGPLLSAQRARPLLTLGAVSLPGTPPDSAGSEEGGAEIALDGPAEAPALADQSRGAPEAPPAEGGGLTSATPGPGGAASDGALFLLPLWHPRRLATPGAVASVPAALLSRPQPLVYAGPGSAVFLSNAAAALRLRCLEPLLPRSSEAPLEECKEEPADRRGGGVAAPQGGLRQALARTLRSRRAQLVEFLRERAVKLYPPRGPPDPRDAGGDVSKLQGSVGAGAQALMRKKEGYSQLSQLNSLSLGLPRLFANDLFSFYRLQTCNLPFPALMEPAKSAHPPKSRAVAPRVKAAGGAAVAGASSAAPPRPSHVDRAPRAPRPTVPEVATGGDEEERGDILPGDVHVASSTNIKLCAGAIAQKLRSFGQTGVIAIGAVSVNQAVKAIILARKYVERDDYEISVSAVLTPDVGPDAVQFLVSKTVPYPDTPVPESAQLRIGRQTQYSNLAGALAGRARDGAMRLSITGSGAGQVLLLVKALALASKFIASDGVVLTGYPDFVDIDEHTFVEMQLFTEKRGVAPS